MIIKQTQFPEKATLNTKDDWRNFWDDYGLGRENNSGAQFTSEPITSKNGILTIPFNKGDWGGAGWQNTGAIIYNSKPYHKGKSIYAEFECKFGKDFDWGNKGDRYRGGKFGFSFTVGDVGVGRKPSPGNFQATTMWRDGGQMDFYFYNYTQAGAWPDKILYTTVERETWYKFGMNIVLNDPGKENGYVQIYIDDELVYEKKDLKLSNSSNGIELFKSAFGNFFGGNSDAWKSRTKSDIQYKYIKIFDSMPEGKFPQPEPEPTPEPEPDPLPEPLPSPVGEGDYDLVIDCGSSLDMYVEGGTAYPVSESLGGKMATERYGEFTYTIPLDSGKHKVSLLFASQFPGASKPRQRVFDVLANGQELLSDFDIVAIAGHMKPHIHTFEITVSSELVLDFIKNIQQPMINAIMISKVSDSGDSIDELKDRIKELEDELESVSKEKDELLEQGRDYENAFSDIKKIIEGF